MRNIRDLLERWGNWSNEKLGTEYPSRAAGIQSKVKRNPIKLCSENDGMTIDSIMCHLKSIKTAQDEYTILSYYYFGKWEPELKRYLKKTTREIAVELSISETTVRMLKQKAEGFVEGCLYMLNIKLECE